MSEARRSSAKRWRFDTGVNDDDNGEDDEDGDGDDGADEGSMAGGGMSRASASCLQRAAMTHSPTMGASHVMVSMPLCASK